MTRLKANPKFIKELRVVKQKHMRELFFVEILHHTELVEIEGAELFSSLHSRYMEFPTDELSSGSAQKKNMETPG